MCVCVLSVITLVKVVSVNWTVNIRGVCGNYHNVRQITESRLCIEGLFSFRKANTQLTRPLSSICNQETTKLQRHLLEESLLFPKHLFFAL